VRIDVPSPKDLLYGVYQARVTDLRDPEARGRINVAWSSEAGTAIVELNSGMVHCSGTLKADTVIATSIVGSLYAPGIGNLR
jgi:hypothetical protein